MSEPAAPSAPAAAPVNRPVPGDGAGQPMPAVQTEARASVDTMRAHLARKNAEQATGAKDRVAAFSGAYEAKQQARRDPRERPDQQQIVTDVPDTQGDPNAQPAAEEGQAPEADPSSVQVEDELEAPRSLEDNEALERFRAWEQDDYFPDEMLTKLHEVKVNGRTYSVDGNELRQGYMRGGDYREKSGQARQLAQQAQAYQAQMNQHFEAIKNPDTMLEVYERNGYGDTLLEVARKVAMRVQEQKGVVRAAAIDAMQRLGIDNPNDHRVQAVMKSTQERVDRLAALDARERRLQYETQQLQQVQQQRQSQEQTEQLRQVYERQLSQLRGVSFRAFGIADNKANQQSFARHFMAVVSSQGFNSEQGVTKEMAMAAAQDLADELGPRAPSGPDSQVDPIVARHGRQQQGRPLPPNRQGLGGGKPVAGPQAQRRTLSDLEAMVRKQRLGQ